jgi:hypothetical protein
MSTYQFHIQIRELDNPPVWRRLLVDENTTFHDFHVIIQIAFDWADSHLYAFSITGKASDPVIASAAYDDGEGEAVDSEEIVLSEIFTEVGQTYVYVYDLGDNWVHDIKLETILDETIPHPTCTGGEGADPIEDCGGPHGYTHLLEVTRDPQHPEYKENREWLEIPDGENLDAHHFDIDQINEELRTFDEDEDE